MPTTFLRQPDADTCAGCHQRPHVGPYHVTADHGCGHVNLCAGCARTDATPDCGAHTAHTTTVFMGGELVPQRHVATDRPEPEPCQAGTPGCSIDHSLDTGTCEGW